jgi:hypothetical protein
VLGDTIGQAGASFLFLDKRFSSRPVMDPERSNNGVEEQVLVFKVLQERVAPISQFRITENRLMDGFA